MPDPIFPLHYFDHAKKERLFFENLELTWSSIDVYDWESAECTNGSTFTDALLRPVKIKYFHEETETFELLSLEPDPRAAQWLSDYQLPPIEKHKTTWKEALGCISAALLFAIGIGYGLRASDPMVPNVLGMIVLAVIVLSWRDWRLGKKSIPVIGEQDEPKSL